MNFTDIAQVSQYELPVQATEVVERRLDPSWIKTRVGRGNIQLDYIEGHRVIRLLNEAFGYKWSFQIVKKETITPDKGRPYIEVLGRLIIPGVGIKEAFGTKELVGDYSQCSKAAMTDSLKKAASLVGIGLELYDDDSSYDEGSYANQYSNQYNDQYMAPPAESQSYYPEEPAPQPAAVINDWSAPEIVVAANTLKTYKRILGIRDNQELDPYVQEWSNGNLQSWRDITPANIQDFNEWLRAYKLEALSA